MTKEEYLTTISQLKSIYESEKDKALSSYIRDNRKADIGDIVSTSHYDIEVEEIIYDMDCHDISLGYEGSVIGDKTGKQVVIYEEFPDFKVTKK